MLEWQSTSPSNAIFPTVQKWSSTDGGRTSAFCGDELVFDVDVYCPRRVCGGGGIHRQTKTGRLSSNLFLTTVEEGSATSFILYAFGGRTSDLLSWLR